MNKQRQIRILSAEDISQNLSMKEAIEAMKGAFASLSEGRAVMPVRSHIEMPSRKGTALFMPSYIERVGRFAVKTVSLFEDNHHKSLPFIQGLVCLFDGQNGSPLAVMDGVSLTALRTGAASGAATDVLARKDAACAAIFGAGVQGRSQLEAVCAVRDIRRAFIIDPNVKSAERFASEMSGKLSIEVIVSDAGRALEKADVVCTATISQSPVFEDGQLAEGVHINAVGSYKPYVQEIPERTVVRAKTVVDHMESALAETGDLIIPISKGLIDESHIYAELGEIFCGGLPGRTSEKEVTLFKSVGVAVQDLCAAAAVFDKAERSGAGQSVPI